MRKDADTLISPFSAVAYTESNWSRGRLVHVFYQARPVLAFVVPATADAGIDGGRGALDTIAIPTFSDNVKFEDDVYDDTMSSSTSGGGQPNTSSKRSKKA